MFCQKYQRVGVVCVAVQNVISGMMREKRELYMKE